MKARDDKTDAAKLRQREESAGRPRAVRSLESVESLSPEATRRLLHSLRVHQIELEAQNEELRRTQVELDASRARYFDLYDLAPVGYITVSEPGLILQANLTSATLLGVMRDDLVRQPLTRFICTDDQDKFYLLRRQLLATGEPQTCELRLVKSGGTFFWANLAATVVPKLSPSHRPDADGTPVLRIVLSDVTEHLRTQQLLAWEKSALEMVGGATSLHEMLDRLMLGLEQQLPGALCSVLLLDDNGINLRHGAAPSLPEAYNRNVDGVAIGPTVGSCGTATYAKRQVIVSDIGSDPLWADYRELAQTHNLHACWSTPICCVR